MGTGICGLTAVPLRSTPSDKAEMVSQMLFGETYQVEDTQAKWLLVKLDQDGYEGWIDRNQHEEIASNDLIAYQSAPKNIIKCLMGTVKTAKGTARLSFGSKICLDSSAPFSVQNIDMQPHDFDAVPKVFDPKMLVKYAQMFVNTPYLWGGKTVFGIDCSGFTQIVGQTAGQILPRDAYQQAAEGTTIDFFQEAKAGDLAFFDNEEGRIVHVGIIGEAATIIHASGKVRIDKLDHHGIFHTEQKIYTHKLRFIKRLS